MRKIKNSVLFISLAPSHSSATRRVLDCQNKDMSIDIYNTDIDKVSKPIFLRIISLDYLAVMYKILTTKSKVVWCWGADTCMIASMCFILFPFSRKNLIWDISDINPAFLGDSFGAKILRRFETVLLKRADLIFLTSPWFYDKYYSKKIGRAKVRVIENFLPLPIVQPQNSPPISEKVVIVYSGIIRSISDIKLMLSVANKMPKQVEFHIHGYPDRNISNDFVREIRYSDSNVIYFERFSANDLPNIYAKAHLTWGFIDQEANENEQWLLTNRIYNAWAYRRPILTNAGTASGAAVETKRLGHACAPDADEICSFLRKLLADEGKMYGALCASMPPVEGAYLNGQYAYEIRTLL